MRPPDDPASAINDALSEVIDLVQDVKQARRKVPQTHALHAALDHLSDDLQAWAQLLMVQDEALGVSPLASMPTVAGRTPANLWPGAVTDKEVQQLLDNHLDQLGRHVSAALAAPGDGDDAVRTALAVVESGVLAHRRELGEPG
jgi:hypothetical protein